MTIHTVDCCGGGWQCGWSSGGRRREGHCYGQVSGTTHVICVWWTARWQSVGVFQMAHDCSWDNYRQSALNETITTVSLSTVPRLPSMSQLYVKHNGQLVTRYWAVSTDRVMSWLVAFNTHLKRRTIRNWLIYTIKQLWRHLVNKSCYFDNCQLSLSQ